MMDRGSPPPWIASENKQHRRQCGEGARPSQVQGGDTKAPSRARVRPFKEWQDGREAGGVTGVGVGGQHRGKRGQRQAAKNVGFGVRTTGFQIPPLPLSSCVTLGWFLNLPKATPPRFSKDERK